MSGKNDAFENGLLLTIFNADYSNAAVAQILGVPGSALANLQLGLHSADPGEAAANQTVNELTYSGYSRMPIPRSTSGWTVSGNAANLAANCDFPASASAGAQTATFFSVGTAGGTSSAGKILYSGPITPPIVVNLGTVPRLTTGTTVTED